MKTTHRSGLRRAGLATGAVSLIVGALSSVVVLVPGVTWAACEGTPVGPGVVTLPTVNAQVNAPAAWNLGVTGQGVDVAVIDTGISPVPGLLLPNKVVDAADLSTDAGDEAGRFRDGEGHGTNMAGIIAGDGSGGPLSKGVAPGARLVNVRVGADDGSVDTTQVVAAIDWVVQNRNTYGRNIRVLNLSYTTDANADHRTDPLMFAVENAWRAGIVVVASAGNDGKGLGRLGNPAADPFIIAVGAAQFDAERNRWDVASFSSHGNGFRNPDVVAPGVSIASLRVPGSMLDTTYPNARFYDAATCTSFFRGSGTSQSAAAVSGAVALLLQQRPTLTPDQVKAILKGTARSITSNPAKQGNGLIDVGAMLSAPTPRAAQYHMPAMGTGSIEGSRGSAHVERSSRRVQGEQTVMGSSFDSREWSQASAQKRSWTNQTYDSYGRLVSGNWSGSSWSGSSWSGSSWSGSSWSGSSWSGSSWSGSSWSGSSWSGSSWS